MSFDQIGSLPLEQQQQILNGSALNPPDGVIPNFDNPPNDNAVALATIIICLVVGTLAVVLRVYSRVVVLKRVYLEDYLALFAFSLFIAFTACGFVLYNGAGFFVHQWDIRLKDLSQVLFIIALASAFYSITIMFLKVAILLEWMRIFVPGGTRGPFWVTSQIILWFNVLFYSSSFIVANLSCTPHARIYDPLVPGTCINDRRLLDVSSASLNVVSHVAIILLPQSVIWKLNMSARKKMGVSLIFAMGILALTSSAFRLAATMKYYFSDDTVYTVSAMALWAHAEMTCVILVFCIPAFRKIVTEKNPLSILLASFRTRISSSTSKSRNTTGAVEESSSQKPSIQNHTYERIHADNGSLEEYSWDTEMGGPAGPRAQHDPHFSKRIPLQAVIRTSQVGGSEESQYEQPVRYDGNYASPWVQRDS